MLKHYLMRPQLPPSLPPTEKEKRPDGLGLGMYIRGFGGTVAATAHEDPPRSPRHRIRNFQLMGIASWHTSLGNYDARK